jgi:ABC-type sugar transport system ATPase subunit
VLRVENIWKSFSGVPVLRDVSLDVRPGEVHALAGANGAGKSTLMNIVSGVLTPDRGTILWDGSPVELKTPADGRALGISFVHQELALVPQLSVGENVFLGRHPRNRFGVAWDEIHERTRQLLEAMGHTLDPTRPVKELGVAEQQLVEIARALAMDARLIIMDEPTAPLSGAETARLFGTISGLRARGVSIIYITHRLPEIFHLADRVTVLRDGCHVLTCDTPAITSEELVRKMVGDASDVVGADALSTRLERARERFRVEGFTNTGKFEDISFDVKAGEVVGLAGLVGAGRTELVEAIFGFGTHDRGTVYLDGAPVRIRNPFDAVRHGMALVPDDRKAKGLVANASVEFNLGLTSHDRFLFQPRQLRESAERTVRDLRVTLSSLRQPVITLSGGNQQKIVLGKWLRVGARVYFLDEPTRGIDVHAKSEIHNLIGRLAREGAGVVVVSSEIDEILGVADRILVMHRGRIAGELTRGNATEKRIVELATGGQ